MAKLGSAADERCSFGFAGNVYVRPEEPPMSEPVFFTLTQRRNLVKNLRASFVGALTFAALLLAQSIAMAECKGEKIDPRWNTNDNKPGTACHRQVAKVRKLEFHPDFECDKVIRQQWQREYEIAQRMGCTL